MFTHLQAVYCFSKINLKRNISIGGEDFLPSPPPPKRSPQAMRPPSGTQTHCDIPQLHGTSKYRQCHPTVTWCTKYGHCHTTVTWCLHIYTVSHHSYMVPPNLESVTQQLHEASKSRLCHTTVTWCLQIYTVSHHSYMVPPNLESVTPQLHGASKSTLCTL